MRRVGIAALVVVVTGLGGVAFAQPEQVTQFEAVANESMKYRHLWIAYGAIWALIFGFVWRTWSRQRATAAELEDLRRRLGALEGRDGGD